MTLRNLLQDLFPADAQPKIIGPDTHGLHTVPADPSIIAYLGEFRDNASALGVPLHALTHHEYIEVNDNTENGTVWTSLSAALLNTTATISAEVNASLGARAGLQLWAGEIGPHNGGSPPCDHTSMRWANFADVFWYVFLFEFFVAFEIFFRLFLLTHFFLLRYSLTGHVLGEAETDRVTFNLLTSTYSYLPTY